MVKVSVEVASGAARFRVSVRARSVRQAASIVTSRNPTRTLPLATRNQGHSHRLSNSQAERLSRRKTQRT